MKNDNGNDCCGDGPCPTSDNRGVTRRKFLKTGSKAGLFASAFGGMSFPVMAGPFDPANFYTKLISEDKKLNPDWVKSLFERGEKEVYSSDAAMKNIGMPIGGLFTGTVYLSCDGRLWNWDIFNRDAYCIAPNDFVYEGRYMKYYWGNHFVYPLEPDEPFNQGFAIRAKGKEVKLDRNGFKKIAFKGEYPRATVTYEDCELPVSAVLEAFSPFIPLNEDDSGLPATVLKYTVKNESIEELELEVYGHLENASCLITRNFLSGTIHNTVSEREGILGVTCTSQSYESAKRKKNNRPRIIFENFDEYAVDRWIGNGEAFEKGPFTLNSSGEVNTYSQNTDLSAGELVKKTGYLRSRSFRINRRYVIVEVSGDYNPSKSGVSVVVDGDIVATASGSYTEKSILVSLDVSHFEGKEAYLEIHDQITTKEPHFQNTGGIGVKEISFSDVPKGEVFNLETQPDFGSMTLALLGVKKGNYATADINQELETSHGKLGQSLIGEVGRKVKLAPGEEAVFTFVVSWYFPNYTNYHMDYEPVGRYYMTRFNSSTEVADYIANNSDRLFSQTHKWVDTWYDSTLPYWFLDRTMANTSTLATNTSYRFKDGRFWGWEGISCCSGTCTHVWQYAQTMARLFPKLERESRDKVDFGIGQKQNGGIAHRINAVGDPIIADDGQLGRILCVYREHLMSEDNTFLQAIWPRVKNGLEFIISKNDPDLNGVLEGDQRNTLDGIWYGKISWFVSLYVAALRATEAMALEMGDITYASRCKKIADSGSTKINELFNGEYFIQKRTGSSEKGHVNGSGKGCFIEQVFGQSWAHWVGLGHIIDKEKTVSALRSLYKYNFILDFSEFRKQFNQGRIFALEGDAGLLISTWPKEPVNKHELSEKFFFEFMTGFEWQVASHMIYEGLEYPDLLQKGLTIAKAIHDRYNGEMRNPYNEIECSDHYSRAMASYGAYQAICGYNYHGPKGELSFAPRLTPENFKVAFTTAEGWGTFRQEIKSGIQKEVIELHYGKLKLNQFNCHVKKGTPTVTLLVNNIEHNKYVLESSTGKLTVHLNKELVEGQKLELNISFV